MGPDLPGCISLLRLVYKIRAFNKFQHVQFLPCVLWKLVFNSVSPAGQPGLGPPLDGEAGDGAVGLDLSEAGDGAVDLDLSEAGDGAVGLELGEAGDDAVGLELGEAGDGAVGLELGEAGEGVVGLELGEAGDGAVGLELGQLPAKGDLPGQL